MRRHRMHRQKIEQAAGEQDAAAAADLDARQAPLGGKQGCCHARHAGADHGDVVALGRDAAHALTSPAASASSGD